MPRTAGSAFPDLPPNHAMTGPPRSGTAGDGGNRAELDRAFVHGIAWTGLIKWISQTLSWATTLIVAHFLMPGDYAVLAVAWMVMSLVFLIAEFGMSTAIVLRTDLDERAYRELHTTSTLLGFAVAAICVPLAIPVAAFFRVEALRLAFPVMGLGFIISGLRTVPWAVMNKRLQFRELALLEASQSATASILSVGLAMLGWGYWALILPNLVGPLVATVWGMAAYAPVSFGPPRRNTVARIGGLSGHILLQRMAWFAYNQADTAITGRVLGQQALGLYTFSATIASTGSEKANELVSRVTTGVFAAAQGSPGELRRYFLATTEILALLILPAALFLSISADWVSTAVFGAQWAAMAPALRLLALAAVVRCLVPPVDRAMMALGRQRLLSGLMLLRVFCLIVGFELATRWGIEGVAVVWVAVHPLVTLPSFAWAVRTLGISGRDLRRALGPAVGLTAASVLVLVLCRTVAPSLGLPRFLVTPSGLALGAATYAGLGAWLFRARFRLMLEHLRWR